MAAVGGRMEVVVPHRSLYAPDYLSLAVLAILAAGIHLWIIANTAVTARDSIGFARYASNLASPGQVAPGEDANRTAIDVIRQAEQPPGFPVAVRLSAKLVHKFAPDLPHPDTYLLAAQLANSLAAILLVIPTYFIGRMLFSRFVGFVSALLMQILPVPAQITSDGLTEGVYVLMAATALMFAVRAVRRPGVGTFLVCGMAVGASYLVRPEGLLVAGAAAVVAFGLGVTGRWPRSLALGRLTALAVGVAFLAIPYMLLIGGITQKPNGKSILQPSDNPKAKLLSTSQARPVIDGPLFAEWMDPPVEGPAPRALWGLQAVAKETVKSLHYLPAILAIAGLVLLRRRLAAEPGLWVLLTLAAMNAGLLVVFAAKVGYVSERHTILLVLVGCVLAAAALEPVATWLAGLPRIGRFWSGKSAPIGLVVMIAATALPSTLKPLHAHREGHKHAGHWLAKYAQPGDVIIDPFEWAQYYSGRTLYFIPPDPADAKVLYSVLENTPDNPHSRLPRLDLAKSVAASGVLVYHWPEDVPPEKARVHVYKTVR